MADLRFQAEKLDLKPDAPAMEKSGAVQAKDYKTEPKDLSWWSWCADWGAVPPCNGRGRAPAGETSRPGPGSTGPQQDTKAAQEFIRKMS